MPEPLFFFATCQVGAEKFLKEELAERAPELKAAYGRPGVVTFKRAQPFPADYRLPSVFARASGVSLDRVPIAGLTADKVKALTQADVIHVYARDHAEPGDESRGSNPLTPVAEQLKQQLGIEREVAQSKELVADVVLVEEDTVLIGYHRQGRGVSPYPGGKPPLELPAEAPSRAYLKLREALLVFDLEPKAGEMAVEIGASPGGAAFALLEAGMNVVGIDPAEADVRLFERSTESAKYVHIRKPFERVSRAELPEKVQWLLADINESPDVTVTAAEKFCQMLKTKPSQLVLTLKLTHPRFAAQVPDFVMRLKKLGYTRVAARQLAFGRKEVVLSAST